VWSLTLSRLTKDVSEILTSPFPPVLDDLSFLMEAHFFILHHLKQKALYSSVSFVTPFDVKKRYNIHFPRLK
jgi:hypothetical protein